MVDTPVQQSSPNQYPASGVTDVFRGQQVSEQQQPPELQQPAVSPQSPQAAQALQPQPEQPMAPDQQSQQEQAQPQQQEYNQDDYYEYPELFPGMAKPVPEELIYEWQAPSRPFKQHNRQYYSTVATVVLLLSLILFFAGQYLPIAAVLAVAFLSYMLSSIPPHTVTVQLTNYGLRLEKELYYWEELGWFWFKEKYGQEMVYVETSRFPNRLALMVGEAETDVLRLIFSEVLLEQEPPPTYFEKAAAWLQEKIPLDIDS